MAYVAITRAKRQLYILTSLTRRIYGQTQTNVPSRFLNELPTQCLELINNANRFYSGGYQNFSSYRHKPETSNYNQNRYHERKSYNSDNEHDYSYEPDEEYYSSSHNLKGQRVFHEAFGYGTLLSVEGQKCEVFFDKFGRKKIMGNFLRKV